jgi:hypothetical protein
MRVRANRTIHWQQGTKEKGPIKSGTIQRGMVFDTSAVGIDDAKAKRMIDNKTIAAHVDAEYRPDPREDLERPVVDESKTHRGIPNEPQSGLARERAKAEKDDGAKPKAGAPAGQGQTPQGGTAGATPPKQ